MSIVAMKRKSRRMNSPISRGSFSLYGAHSTTTLNTSGFIASRIKRIPIHVESYNGEDSKPYDSQGTYIYDVATNAEKCNNGNKQLNAGFANCLDKTCSVQTLFKSQHTYGAVPSSQHVRTIGHHSGCDS
jgi:hypothetical protein